MIVVLEGLDNAGKTTLTNLLNDYYKSRNINIEISKELLTPVGKTLKEMIVNKDIDPILKTYLFACDRYYRMKDQNYEVDTIYLFDRYVPSAIAYREAEGVDTNWVRSINSIFPKPDLCFFIDISAEESIKRNTDTKFNIKYTENFLKKVRASYLSLSSEYEMITINGTMTPKEIMAIITSNINQVMTNKKELNKRSLTIKSQ